MHKNAKPSAMIHEFMSQNLLGGMTNDNSRNSTEVEMTASHGIDYNAHAHFTQETIHMAFNIHVAVLDLCNTVVSEKNFDLRCLLSM